MTLVQANARLTLAGVVAPTVAGSLAAAVIKVLGHRAELGLGAAVYAVAALTAFRLPRAVDGGASRRAGPVASSLTGILSEIHRPLVTAAALRWLSGLLLLFGAFVVRVHPIGGLAASIALGELALGIAAGNVAGTALGSRIAAAVGVKLGGLLLAATAAASSYAAYDFGVVSIFTVAFVASAAGAIAKLALDATIQRRVGDDVRTTVFGRSETVLQLSWVVGGGIGIVLPTRPEVGFGLAAAVLVGALFAVAAMSRRQAGSSRVPDREPTIPVVREI
jgi:hypothetical protein